MDSGTQFTLAMSAPPDDVDTVHALLQEVWSNSPAVSATDRVCFETALIELAGNVIQHADAGTGVSCTLTVEVFGDRIEARLSDTGEPGQFHLVPGGMPHELAESGRGIPLIEALVDELHYDRSGSLNLWRISRRLGTA
ncbi:ATP-binding protein [Lacisediminihabitans profunda]|uniref:ATP-binding protein n=1 Tax=Lacisediminihabitans profunda TaxID=2594790 RepID=A0A5C8USB2_9MICO|nr:ATP-binding protein [Lacisediminihabitans profunda]TXN31127.1 ATP-binding protein [Lacisediminihabitans profunda]